MYYVFSKYLTNRISASNVQFRAGSSLRGSGGTLHPAFLLTANPLYDDYTIDFDMAVARVSDYVFANLNLQQRKFKLDANTLNESGSLVYNLKAMQITGVLTLRNTTNRN